MDLPTCDPMTDGLSLEGLIQLQSLMEKAGKAEVKRMRRALAVMRTPPNTESKEDISKWLRSDEQLEPKKTEESFDSNFIERVSVMVAYTPAAGGKTDQSVVINAHISADTFSLTVHGIARPDIEKHGVDNSQFLQIQSPEVPLQRDGVMHLRQYQIEVDADDDKRNSLMLLWRMKEAIDLSKDLSSEQDLPDKMNTDAVRYSAFWWANKVLSHDKCVEEAALNMIFRNGVQTRSSAITIAEGLSAARTDANSKLARFVISECIAAVRKIDQTQRRLSKAVGRGKIMKLTLPEPGSARDFMDVMCPATFIEFESDKERYIVQREGEEYKFRRNWHGTARPTTSAVLANEIDKGSSIRVRGHNALCLVKEDLLNLEWALVLNSQKKSRMKATLDLDIDIILRPSGDPKTQYIKREQGAPEKEGWSIAGKAAAGVGAAAAGVGAVAGVGIIDQTLKYFTGDKTRRYGILGGLGSLASVAYEALPGWALPAASVVGAVFLYNHMRRSSDIPKSTFDSNIKDYLKDKIQDFKNMRITTTEPPGIDDANLQLEIRQMVVSHGVTEEHEEHEELVNDLNKCIVYGVMWKVLDGDTFADMAKETRKAHVIAERVTEKVASVMQDLKNELEDRKKHAQSAASAAPAAPAAPAASAEPAAARFGDSRVMIARL